MGRPRKDESNASRPTMKWGCNKPSLTTLKRPDGTTRKVWRCAYYIYDLVRPDGADLWEGIRARHYAKGDTDVEAAKKAEKMSALNQAYCKETFPAAGVSMTFKDWLNENDGDLKSTGIDAIGSSKIAGMPPTSKTFEQVAREYMLTRGRYSRDGNPVELKSQYLRTIEYYIRQAGALGASNMDALGFPQISSWFSEFQKSHVQGTACRYRAWLCQVGKYAERSEYWRSNLFDSLPKLSMMTRKNEKRVWSLDEIDSMFEAATTAQQKAMLILLRLGLRQGEILGLTEEDLTDENSIRIRYSLNQVNVGNKSKGHWIPFLDRPKTDASAAEKVRVPRIWMESLRESLRLSNNVQIRAWDDDISGSRSHRFVVSNAFGEPWAQSPSNYVLQRLMNRAKVSFFLEKKSPRVRPTLWHSWRYTYASELVAFGANDIELMVNLRHTDSNLSKSVYAQARLTNKSLYEPYKPQIETYLDYNDAICKFDLDRRALKAVQK